MLYWAKGNLPGAGTVLADADVTSSTLRTRKKAGILKQLGQTKRQKSQGKLAKNDLGNVETPSSGEASLG
ncbi:hypothetical protein LC613_04680 [Nostoc sphaeroides CHAB 2801]|nr:hypothetical protein [Nostoc sphaeroides]MCC5627487.1 hypothetical protein [Nostoc sphaeroides CHAB 2801]